MKYLRAATAILGLSCSLCAFADPGRQEYGRESSLREQTRALQMEQLAQREQAARPEMPRNERSQPSADNASNRATAPSADESRRGGRMTPEDRRALRRQIDEAGHEIYTPPSR